MKDAFGIALRAAGWVVLLAQAACGGRAPASLDDAGAGVDDAGRDGAAGCVVGNPVAIGSASGGIAVNGTHVYWFDGQSVMRAAIEGGVPELVVAVSPWRGSLAVDVDHIYWTRQSSTPTALDGVVMRAALDGANPEIFAADQASPTSIAFDGTTVYWANYAFDGRIMKAPREGGAALELATSSGSGLGWPKTVAVDAMTVFWLASNNGMIMKVPATGGSSGFAIKQPYLAESMVVREGSVYWLSERSEAEGGGVITRTDVADGKVTTIATGQFGGATLAVDATSVFWANWGIDGGFEGHIMMAPVTGGTATTFIGGNCFDALFPPHASSPSDIAIDSKYVYWIADLKLWKAAR